MTRLLFLSALLLLLTGSAAAQESPGVEIDFVRKLRAKGYHDLALEYIVKLQKGADAKQSALLTLERGRTEMALAREKDPEQRAGLLESARMQLEEFVRKNPADPETALTRLEIARLASYIGEALLGKALREEEGRSQQDLAKKAEAQFLRAGAELDGAIKTLPEELRSQARFDRAINFMNSARTILGQDNIESNRRRGDLIVDAKKIFETLGADDKSEIGPLAQAWLVKCNLEIQAPVDAKKYYDRVLNLQGKNAQAAQRAAKLFFIQGAMDNATLSSPPLKLDFKGKLKFIEDECRKWLAAYPAYQKSPEGWAIRYELGHSLFKQGQLVMGKETVASKAALALFEQAQKQFAPIADSGSEYSEKANQKTIQISYIRMGEKTAVADLKDFEECYLKAQVEMVKVRNLSSELEKANASQRPDLQKKRKEHHATSLQALRRALALVDAKTPPSQIDDASFFLGCAYFDSGDIHRAAVAWDRLGRSRPPGKRAATAAGQAIQAYTALLQRDPADEGVRQRLRSLAEFALTAENQKNWAGDSVTAVARYQLAMLYNRDADYKKAIELLEWLPRDFSGYIYAQADAVFIAQKARQIATDAGEKKLYQALALAALQRMNPLPADADPLTTRMYFFAHLEQSSLLYADAAAELNRNDFPKATARYHDMARFLDELKARFDKLPLDRLGKEAREQFERSWDAMKMYSRVGRAEVDYRGGKYDKVLSDMADVVAVVNKLKGDLKTHIKLRNHQAISDMLVLSMRALVQKGKTDNARDLMKVIENLRGEDGSELEQTNLTEVLIADIRTQVDSLKKAGDREKLKAVVANFSAFVDELAKRLDQKALKPAELSFLAQSYNSLEEYGKAAALYARIPEPACLNTDQPNADEDRELAFYWSLQLQYGKSLRLSAKNKDDFVKAKKVLDRIVSHKNGRQQLLAEMENLHILEDLGLFSTASKGWTGIMNNPGLKKQLATPPANQDEAKRHQLAKELYFEAYYQNAWCVFKYSRAKKTPEAPDVAKKYLALAANSILRLENAKNPEGWSIVGGRFQELMRNEPMLQAAYEELKKGTK